MIVSTGPAGVIVLMIVLLTQPNVAITRWARQYWQISGPATLTSPHYLLGLVSQVLAGRDQHSHWSRSIEILGSDWLGSHSLWHRRADDSNNNLT